jgi:hypothetical protein
MIHQIRIIVGVLVVFAVSVKKLSSYMSKTSSDTIIIATAPIRIYLSVLSVVKFSQQLTPFFLM